MLAIETMDQHPVDRCAAVFVDQRESCERHWAALPECSFQNKVGTARRAYKSMPKEIEDQARKELRRLQRIPEAAAEYGMVRTYLDWLIELPWSLPEEPSIDIAEARRILDEDH